MAIIDSTASYLPHSQRTIGKNVHISLPSYVRNSEFQTIFESHRTYRVNQNRDDILKAKNNIYLQQPKVSPALIQGNADKADWKIEDYYKIARNDIEATLQNVDCKVSETDFSGMSDIEIYDFIESVFIEAFGENFKIAESLRYPCRDTEGFDYVHIGMIFSSTLYRHFGNNANIPNINRQRLYGNMSTTDVQDSIRSKYPDNLTNRELFILLSELASVGVDAGLNGMKHGYSDFIIGYEGLQSMTNNEYIAQYEKMLDMSADTSVLSGFYNMSVYTNRGPCPPETKDILIRCFGAILNSNSYLASDWFSEYLKETGEK